MDAVFAAIRQAVEQLLPYENVKIYGYLMDEEIVADLDNYCDNIHHSGDVCRKILAMLRADEGRLTEENLEETLANWREFVIHYDYEKFWDEDFWTPVERGARRLTDPVMPCASMRSLHSGADLPMEEHRI